MDVIQTEGVKVPNSVLVGGLTGDEVDNEVIDYLGQFGSIGRVIKVTSTEAQFKNTAIVEFQSGEPVQFLKDSLPCKRQSHNPSVVHHIQLLSALYAADRGSCLTHSYLTELKGLAKLSGADFEKVLLDELARMKKSTESNPTVGPNVTVPNQNLQLTSDIDQDEPAIIEHQSPVKLGSDLTHLPEHDSHSSSPSVEVTPSHRKTTIYLPPEQLTTPEVQRVVVEHVIKNNEMPSHGHAKLRPFSGKTPCSTFEADYDTWRNNVEFHLTDSTISDKHMVRKIVESLLPPAANIVKHLGPNASPHDYLSLLDSAYGTVDDGDELFAKFLSTNQNSGEKPSAYLQRLQITLSKVIKRGGITTNDSDRQLLKQFCRGCWNNSLITTLQLEQKKDKPPSFPELLLLLRTEEDRQAAKSSRMKQHLGISKPKAHLNSLEVGEYVTDDTDVSAVNDRPVSFDAHKLERKLAKLQAQVASLKASAIDSSSQNSDKPNKKTKPKFKVLPEEKSDPSETKLTKKPRPWYCFRCGEDGHIAPSCSNEPNPELVEMKRKEFNQKLQVWEEQNMSALN
ncbi:unnamed protein product [Oreochromis niloticus]|nr:unnamed protein product [Mustela putorius furo]